MGKIVVSFTSYPNRIKTVYKVVESLLDQTEKADDIVLWLSKLEFPKQCEDIPQNLKKLIGKNGFHIEWIDENLKSHKKYFYMLQNNEAVVITVDDDMYYSRSMVHTLMESYRNHPNAISARNASVILRRENYVAPYIEWESCTSEYMGIERMDLCAIGVNGILYPPYCADKKWFNKKIIENYAENQDDLWLKYNQIIDGIPVVYTGIDENDILIDHTQDNALYKKNVGERNNDNCIKILLNKLRTDYEKVYCEWFQNLIERGEFVASKRQYYIYKIRELFMNNCDKNIYICGAGEYAHILLEFLKKCGCRDNIEACLVSKRNDEDIAVKQIDELGENEKFIVLCGVSEKHKAQMKRSIEKYKFCEWIDIGLQDIVRLEKMID